MFDSKQRLKEPMQNLKKKRRISISLSQLAFYLSLVNCFWLLDLAISNT
jgi:hypothetical protein